jgi:predicted  nucleic acid-binding Zn-ribbon protein
MALKDGARGWLDAASSQAIAELRGELERVVRELADVRADAARRQGEMDALRGELVALTQRIDNYPTAEAFSASVDNLVETSEALRLRIVAQAEQNRWEWDDLRKALTILAERIASGAGGQTISG